jgi:hypothetical protein
MPCMKCANGKWKYGANGNCQFDTLSACNAAAAAIHANDKAKKPVSISTPAGPHQAPNHPYATEALPMVPVAPEIFNPSDVWTHPSPGEDMTDALMAQYR